MWQPDTINVVTNHHWRPVLGAHELTAHERDDFDFLDWEAIERGDEHVEFIEYRGSLYLLSDFERPPLADHWGQWDGVQTQSAFDAVAIRYSDDYEHVQVAHVHW